MGPPLVWVYIFCLGHWYYCFWWVHWY